jgi:phage-related protein
VIAELRAQIGDFSAKMGLARDQWASTAGVISDPAPLLAAQRGLTELATTAQATARSAGVLGETSREAFRTMSGGITSVIPGMRELGGSVGKVREQFTMMGEASRAASEQIAAGIKADQLELARLGVGMQALIAKQDTLAVGSRAYQLNAARMAEFQAQTDATTASMVALAREQSKVAAAGKLRMAGAAVAAPVAVGAVVGAAVGYEAVKAALADENAQALLKNAVDKTTESYARFKPHLEDASAQMRKLGFTNADTAASAQRLTTSLHDPEKALNLVGLAANVARARHIDLASATALVAKASVGNTSVLTRMGLASKDAAGNTLTAKAAIDRLGQAYGGAAAAYASTLQGKWGVFKSQIDSVLAVLGEKLKPMLSRMLDWFEAGARAVAGMKPKFEAFKSAVETAWTKLQPLVKSVGDLVRAVGPAVAQIGSLAGALAKNIAGPVILGIVDLAAKLGPPLLDAIKTVVTKLGEFADWIKKHTAVLAGLTAAIIVGLIPSLIALSITLGGAVLAAVSAVAAAAAAMWLAITGPVGLTVIAIGLLVAAFVEAWKHSEKFRDIVVGVINAVTNGVVDGVKIIASSLIEWARINLEVVKKILDAGNWVLGLFGASLPKAVTDAVNGAMGDLDALQGRVNALHGTNITIGVQVVQGLAPLGPSGNGYAPGAARQNRTSSSRGVIDPASNYAADVAAQVKGQISNLTGSYGTGLSNVAKAAKAAGGGGAGSAAKSAHAAAMAKAHAKAAAHKADMAAKRKAAHETLVQHRAEVAAAKAAAKEAAAQKKQELADAKAAAAAVVAQQKADMAAAKQAALALTLANRAAAAAAVSIFDGGVLNRGADFAQTVAANNAATSITVNVAGHVTTERDLLASIHESLLTFGRTNIGTGLG